MLFIVILNYLQEEYYWDDLLLLATSLACSNLFSYCIFRPVVESNLSSQSFPKTFLPMAGAQAPFPISENLHGINQDYF